MPLLHFKLKEVMELFTTFEYNTLLKNVREFFIEECLKQGIIVELECVKTYFNPGMNEGCLEYRFVHCEDLPAYIPDMDFPLANDYLTVQFY
jgi:hypothetical protein